MALVALVLAMIATVNTRAADAQGAGSWVDYGQGRVRLVSATAAAAGDRLLLGLHYVIAPGWEIYWRSPGEAGYPTTVDWTGSDNLRAGDLQWPLPRRFRLLGVETYGYKDEVVLPIHALVERQDQGVKVRGEARFLTCNEVCVPHTVNLALDLPAGHATLSPYATLLNRFQSRVPQSDTHLGLTLERAEIVVTPKGEWLRVAMRSDEPLRAPDVLVEGPREFVFSTPATRLTGDGRGAVVDVPVAASVLASTNVSLVGKPLTLTLVDGDRAREVATVPVPGAIDAAVDGSLLAMVLIALLGGLILNVMPCVLPVLAVKVLAVVDHAGNSRRATRIGFLASAGGIVATFLLLAAVLAGVRAAGVAIGWGFQFQQPLFIAAMALVITFFAATLLGWFEIRLPAALAGAVGRPTTDHRLGTSFLTGMFATILATPCSAPFVGTAVGFALSRGPWEIVAMFAAMGLGMAAPYIAVALVPRIVEWFPRPGRWMLVVRQVMAVALVATVVWLVSVLAVQVSTLAAVVLAVLLSATLLLLAWRHRAAAPRRRWLTLAAMSLAVVTIVAPAIHKAETALTIPDARWVAFDPGSIAGHVAEGRIVFVDVTADWCVTCKVNKELVLNRGAVAEILADARVVAMRADWTRPDERIARYLEGFRRFGIPFNAVYGRQAPGGIALPELLREDVVVAAIRQAGGAALAARQ